MVLINLNFDPSLHKIFPIVVVIRRETKYVPFLEDEEVYKTICSLPVGRSAQVG